jgi:hypothetical protein
MYAHHDTHQTLPNEVRNTDRTGRRDCDHKVRYSSLSTLPVGFRKNDKKLSLADDAERSNDALVACLSKDDTEM